MLAPCLVRASDTQCVSLADAQSCTDLLPSLEAFSLGYFLPGILPGFDCSNRVAVTFILFSLTLRIAGFEIELRECHRRRLISFFNAERVQRHCSIPGNMISMISTGRNLPPSARMPTPHARGL